LPWPAAAGGSRERASADCSGGGGVLRRRFRLIIRFLGAALFRGRAIPAFAEGSDLAHHISALIINQSTDNMRHKQMSHARKEYRDFMALTPDAYAAVLALGQVAGKAGMDKQLLELIKLRASQINGCAFCVQYHILEGEKLGVPADKLNLVVVWREAPQFSPRGSGRHWPGRRR
jgi:AhpD family alkylhydroperoxidase